MTHDDAIERAARRIAEVQGDDFDECPKSKSDWIEKRGHFDGRYRDINEPFQSCYLRMAEAALGDGVVVPAGWKLVPVEPTPEMLKAYSGGMRSYINGFSQVERVARWGAAKKSRGHELPEWEKAISRYRAMLQAAPSVPFPPKEEMGTTTDNLSRNLNR